MDAIAEFNALLFERLLPEFCLDPSRGYALDRFRVSSNRISEIDAVNFCRAWHGGLIEHIGRGQYRAALSSASEQFFWNLKSGTSTEITLWHEPIITVGTLARLHFDFGWPRGLLGMQSKDWAFDVVAHQSPDSVAEAIACEIKKTDKEIWQLIDLMREFGRQPTANVADVTGKARNAAKKIHALRLRHAPVFWAIGPAGTSRAFDVSYSEDGTVELIDADEAVLAYCS